MKATTLVLALALVGVSGTAIANPKDDPQSAFVLDLTPAGGSSYHVNCQKNAELSNCQQASLWENTNGLRGLQTGKTATQTSVVNPDSLLLG